MSKSRTLYRAFNDVMITVMTCHDSQSADSPLLQLSTSHQELPTRTHPDHCSDGKLVNSLIVTRLDYCNCSLILWPACSQWSWRGSRCVWHLFGARKTMLVSLFCDSVWRLVVCERATVTGEATISVIRFI